MSLETLYNAATLTSYVGRVRSTQAADVGPGGYGVNFLDGKKKNPSTTSTADEFQTEFRRSGYTAPGGAQGTVPSENNKRYLESRWTSKALKLAFENQGPPSLAQGYYIDRFRMDNRKNMVHLYTPIGANGYVNKNSSASAKVNLPATS